MKQINSIYPTCTEYTPFMRHNQGQLHGRASSACAQGPVLRSFPVLGVKCSIITISKFLTPFILKFVVCKWSLLGQWNMCRGFGVLCHMQSHLSPLPHLPGISPQFPTASSPSSGPITAATFYPLRLTGTWVQAWESWDPALVRL